MSHLLRFLSRPRVNPDVRRLSPHFTLHEFTRSRFADVHHIDNTPAQHLLPALTRTAEKLEEVRRVLRTRILVRSGYRSPRVNQLARGSEHSQHMTGEAVDFEAPDFGSPRDVCMAIIEAGIQFDQLIEEPSWVHISTTVDRDRAQVMRAVWNGDRWRYLPGLS